MTADLLQLLASLGNTADAVADKLRSLGIKGTQVSACDCPVARFVNANGFSGASVNHLTVMVDNPAMNFRTAEVNTPRAVARFLDQFDTGVHLDLVEISIQEKSA